MTPTKPLLLFTLFLLAAGQLAFSQDTTWFNAAYKTIPARQGASYYRTRISTDSGLFATVHFLTGQPEMTGHYSDDSLKIRKGQFKWYDSNGTATHICTYLNDKKEGPERYYYHDGKLQAMGAEKNDTLDGAWVGYYPSGKLSGKAFYADRKQVSAEFFLEDGSPNKNATVFFRNAVFPGGPSGLLHFIMSTVKYPRPAYRHDIQGEVIVQFKVTKEGKAAGIHIVKSVDKSLDEEALRVIRKSPDWAPAILGGVPVDYYCNQPIVFKLEAIQ